MDIFLHKNISFFLFFLYINGDVNMRKSSQFYINEKIRRKYLTRQEMNTLAVIEIKKINGVYLWQK